MHFNLVFCITITCCCGSPICTDLNTQAVICKRTEAPKTLGHNSHLKCEKVIAEDNTISKQVYLILKRAKHKWSHFVSKIQFELCTMANDGQRVSFHFRNLQINLMLRLKAEKRLLHRQQVQMTGPRGDQSAAWALGRPDSQMNSITSEQLIQHVIWQPSIQGVSLPSAPASSQPTGQAL